MKIKDLREKESAALGEELLTERRRLFDLRTQAVTEKLEDPSQIRKSRRAIARILTVMNEKKSKSAKA